MSLTGAGIGAVRSLEDIVAERMLAQKLQQEIELRQASTAREDARTREAAEQNRWERSRAERLDAERLADRTRERDMEDTARRGRSSMAGVLSMGLDPETTRKEIAFSSLNSGADVPKGVMDMMTTPEPKKYPVRTVDAKGNPINRLVTEAEMQAGVPEYRAPEKAESGSYLTLIDSNGNQRRVTDGPQANQMLGQGWKLFDPVAARSSRPTDDPEARDTAAEAKRLASELLGAKGFAGAFGLMNSRLPTISQDTADAEAIKNALTGMLTLENMNKMKGVLSDSDMKVLRQASTTLSGPISPEAGRRELQRVIDVMSRASGESSMPKLDLATSRGGSPQAPRKTAAEYIAQYGGKPK